MTRCYRSLAKPIGQTVGDMEWITIEAHDPAHALRSLEEMFPGYIFSIPTLAPEWEE